MISFERDPDGWGRILFTRPEQKNKFTVSFLKEATGIFQQIHSEKDSFQVISIESKADSIFAAGADMTELLQLNRRSAEEYSLLGQSLMELIEECPVPVIALVCGPCIGGGFDLALSCHSIFGTHRAVFAHPGVFLGLVTGFGGTVRLAEKIGVGPAREALLTGRSIHAEEALQLGLIDRLFHTGSQMREYITETYLLK